MRKYLFLPILLMVFIGIQAQNSVYVSPIVANDSGDGSSWENAKKYIASGIAALHGNPGTVFVMAGEYVITEEILIPAGVTVLGGYSQISTNTDTAVRNLPGVNSNWQDNTYCTIIKGDGTFRIATVGGLLDGCVLRNGFSSTMGGGALIDGGTVSHCVLMGCDAIAEDDASAEGGGAYIRNNGTLTNCVVTECRGDNGSAVSGEDGSIINNTITRNWPSQCGTVKDYDGNTYHTVRLGNQCWMRENLRTTRYADGTQITTTSGTSTTIPYYYQNTSLDVVQYGLFYNWAAVMNGAGSSNTNPSGVQGVCPNGWHVPSAAEWDELANYVSSIPGYRCGTNEGSFAKALASRTGWRNTSSSCAPGNNQSSNNTTRFNALPGGGYNGVGYSAEFTSSTVSPSNSGSVTVKYLYYDSQGLYTRENYTSYKYNSFSVRCVKNEE